MKKFTNIENEIIKENANIELKFNEHLQSIFAKLDKIKIGIDDLAIKQQKDPRNWGYVGSLEKINYELDDIIDFLGLKEEDDDDIKES